MSILATTEKFEFQSMESWCKAVRDSLNLSFCAVVAQKNDFPCILLTGFGFVSCLNKGIAFALY